ncbi:MAG: ester cyclase [Pseudomonadota bacterium]
MNALKSSLAAASMALALATPAMAHIFETQDAPSQGEIGRAITEMATELAERQADEERVARNLETFRQLDLEVFSNAELDRFDESHHPDVVVYMPDGRVVYGLEDHLVDVGWFFIWAPDTHVERHIARFGQGEWTAAIGVLKGTFTADMPLADGSILEANGNSYEINFTTVARWEEGLMVEEYLFWDNDYFFSQLTAE